MSFKGHNFKKQFGQNFISDHNFLTAIVADAGVTNEDTVVEVGAGAGTLTKEIAKIAKRVIAYEIDRDLQSVLTEVAGEYPNVEFVFGDFLKSELNHKGNYKVVANLPYYITAPVIMRFLQAENPPTQLTVMLQKEVGERLAAKPNTAEYGAFTLQVGLLAEVKFARFAPKELFYPRPKVDSAVVNLVYAKKYTNEKTAELKRLIKAAFAMRRKTLVNNLGQAGYDKSRIKSAIAALKLPEAVRGEFLSLEQFAALHDLIVLGN
jgi:16S rRNA (adenine1518-N6/adenine1519-N6)-dimethyltransferase